MNIDFNEILIQKGNPCLTLKRGEFVKYRIFKSIKINDDYSLSIQASPFHECDKKDDVYKPNEYNTFEIAILKRCTFKGILLDENIVDFKKLDLLKDFPRFNELCSYETEKYSIGNVPKDLIIDLYNYLIKE